MVNEYQENYGTGWISLYRSVQKHWIFDNDKYFKWWIIMLFEANHQDKKLVLGYEVFEIKKGQSANSLRTWARLFNTGTKSVTKFFKMLEKDSMITKETIGKGKQSTTLINIDNYGTYQGSKETQRDTQGDTLRERKGYTNNNVNNVNKEINIPFDEFWNLYDKKTGKDKCEKKWKALKDDERKKIIDVLQKYIDSTPDKQYRKNPITWLNQKCWEDEIEETPKRERTDAEKYLAGEIPMPKIRMGL